MDKIRSQWVVNYEPDEDIQVLSGDLDLDALKCRFPNCYERYLATLYFNRRGEVLARQGDEVLAIWFFRAALAHFQGILDLIGTDMPANCGQMWERSEIQKNLYSHDLVYTMTRVRNIALHTGKLKCSMQNQQVTFLPGGRQDITQLMLDPIGVDHFDRKDRITNDTVKWFNRQAVTWSAHALLEESCFILMAALDNFVRMNEQHIGQPEDALDKIRRAERALSCK
jgi:hypothetical protein